MDHIIQGAFESFESFSKNHLQAPPGKSPLSLHMDSRLWDWSQLWSPREFEWKVGTTPLADLAVIRLTWVAYFTTIIGLKVFMSDRPAMKLRMATAIHNLILCIGSLAMFIAGAMGAFEVYQKPIIFLHWYHHAIVILMVWGWLEAKFGFGVFGLLFNTGVHVFMYWYYFASNMGWNVWFKVMLAG
ncbi:hypothetical protein HDU91_000315 [Kappamyces sp. JEL0680]|nr:hypothetical protein HDU91_000315 [Kappamyces sp. JEL0680]